MKQSEEPTEEEIIKYLAEQERYGLPPGYWTNIHTR